MLVRLVAASPIQPVALAPPPPPLHQAPLTNTSLRQLLLVAIFERDIVIFNEGEVIPRKYGVRLGQQATWGLEPTRTSVATVKALKFAACDQSDYRHSTDHNHQVKTK